MRSLFLCLIITFIGIFSCEDGEKPCRKNLIILKNESGVNVKLLAYFNGIVVREDFIPNDDSISFTNNCYLNDLPYGRELKDNLRDSILVVINDRYFIDGHNFTSIFPETEYFKDRMLSLGTLAYLANIDYSVYTYTFVPEDYDNAIPCTPDVCD